VVRTWARINDRCYVLKGVIMSKYTRDDIDKFHDYDIYIPTRTLYIGPSNEDGITDVIVAERLIKNLHILESLNSNPITILMNNPLLFTTLLN
jgi:hypothetical protein